MFVINYIVQLGASVMMPIIFTLLGLVLGLGLGKSLKSGLSVGVGFVGLSVVTSLLSDNLGPAVNKMTEIYNLKLNILDIGWPAASQIAFGSKVGAIMIPLGLIINMIMIITKTTRTVNIDIWNYWHFAFIGSIVYIGTQNLGWGIFAASVSYIITLVIADRTASNVSEFYKDLDGIALPQAFCAAYVPFAVVINKILDAIPGINKIDIDAEGMQKKFGVIGEPIFLGVIVGVVLGTIARYPLANVLKLGITMSAVMVLIPRITGLFIEGLVPISEATKAIIEKKFSSYKGLKIGMSPALVIGHPTTLVVSLLLVPCILFISVILPGNQFLPLTSLAGLIYIFPLILPITKGNVFKTFIIGLIMLVAGNYIATDIATIFTQAAVISGVSLPEGINAVASIDFAASPMTWIIYNLSKINMIGPAILSVMTLLAMLWNRKKIKSNDINYNNLNLENVDL